MLLFVLVRWLCSGARGSCEISAARCCCVRSWGKPFSHQRSPGSALRLKASLRCWFCDITAFTKSWIRLDGLSQPMLRRESSGPASESSVRELESDEGEKQERDITKHWRLVLNSPIWTRPQAVVRIRVSVWGRAPPRTVCVPCLCHLIFNSYHERYPYRPLYVL